MPIAVLAWSLLIVLTSIFLNLCWRRGDLAACAVFLVLIPQTMVRPVLFFLGLDQPFPYDEFSNTPWQLVAFALGVIAVWILVFSIAHLTCVRIASPFRILLPNVSRQIDMPLLLTASVVVTLIGTALTAMCVLKSGSVANFMYSVKVGKEMAGLYIIRELSVVAAIFSALALVCSETQRREENRGKASRTWFCVSLFIGNLAVNYLWGNRYNIAMLSCALAIAWHFRIRQIRLYRLAILLALAVASLQGLKLVRNSAVETAAGRNMDRDHSVWLSLSTSLHLSQFDALMLALRDAGSRFDFRDGQDFKNGLLSWIPRKLNPDKETFHVGRWFRQVYQPEKVNGWPITTAGSWYVNFGYFGIIAGALLSGFVTALLDTAYRRKQEYAWHAVICPSLALLLLDGGVGTGFVQRIFLILVPVFILAMLLNVRWRRRCPSLQ